MNTPLDQITDHIRTAAAQRNPLRIRGGGTKDFIATRCKANCWTPARSRTSPATSRPSWWSQPKRAHRCVTWKPHSWTRASAWRLSVPPTTPVLNLPWAQLVEWHGGQRWLWAPASAQAELRQAATSVGGTATLFRTYTPDNTWATGRFNPLEPMLHAVHRRLKTEFDPAGILNPARMYPDL